MEKVLINPWIGKGSLGQPIFSQTHLGWVRIIPEKHYRQRTMNKYDQFCVFYGFLGTPMNWPPCPEFCVQKSATGRRPVGRKRADLQKMMGRDKAPHTSEDSNVVKPNFGLVPMPVPVCPIIGNPLKSSVASHVWKPSTDHSREPFSPPRHQDGIRWRNMWM